MIVLITFVKSVCCSCLVHLCLRVLCSTGAGISHHWVTPLGNRIHLKITLFPSKHLVDGGEFISQMCSVSCLRADMAQKLSLFSRGSTACLPARGKIVQGCLAKVNHANYRTCLLHLPHHVSCHSSSTVNEQTLFWTCTYRTLSTCVQQLRIPSASCSNPVDVSVLSKQEQHLLSCAFGLPGLSRGCRVHMEERLHMFMNTERL